MAPIPATARSRPAGDWRSDLGLVIEGEAVLVSRVSIPPAGARERVFPPAAPQWGAALHAANTNAKRTLIRRRRPRSLGVWASLGAQTGAAVIGLIVLVSVAGSPPAAQQPAEPELARIAAAWQQGAIR